MIVCDAVLKALALVGGCGPGRWFRFDLVGDLWTAPPCVGSPMAGPSIVLWPELRNGILLGLGPALDGVRGQLWGLALLAAATAVTVVILRWRWRSGADALALGALWGGILIHAGPRLFAGGSTITSIRAFGSGLALGDLIVVWAALWLAWRVIAELRA